jgi:hypothetical protein
MKEVNNYLYHNLNTNDGSSEIYSTRNQERDQEGVKALPGSVG